MTNPCLNSKLSKFGNVVNGTVIPNAKFTSSVATKIASINLPENGYWMIIGAVNMDGRSSINQGSVVDIGIPGNIIGGMVSLNTTPTYTWSRQMIYSLHNGSELLEMNAVPYFTPDDGMITCLKLIAFRLQ